MALPTTMPKGPRGFLFSFDAWGKPWWQVLHAVTFNYPDKPDQATRDRVMLFFKLVPFLLPCGLCGVHFYKAMKDGEYALTADVLQSRDTLSRWLVDVHNHVNQRLRKPAVTYERCKTYYLRDCSRDPRTGAGPSGYCVATWVLAALLVVALGATGWLTYQRLRDRHNLLA